MFRDNIISASYYSNAMFQYSNHVNAINTLAPSPCGAQRTLSTDCMFDLCIWRPWPRLVNTAAEIAIKYRHLFDFALLVDSQIRQRACIKHACVKQRKRNTNNRSHFANETNIAGVLIDARL